MSVSVEVKYNKTTFDKLKKLPDKEVYEVARQTLDRVGQMEITPYRKGRMQQTMYSHGVTREASAIYTIGNYTDYATYVYKMPQNSNWTNPKSKSKWFEWFWRNQGKTVIESVVERNKL